MYIPETTFEYYGAFCVRHAFIIRLDLLFRYLQLVTGLRYLCVYGGVAKQFSGCRN